LILEGFAVYQEAVVVVEVDGVGVAGWRCGFGLRKRWGGSWRWGTGEGCFGALGRNGLGGGVFGVMRGGGG